MSRFKRKKYSSTGDILGLDIDTYRKLIKFQLTSEMNWTNVKIDHVKLICMFDKSKDEGIREGFCWKNNQLLIK